MITQVRTPEHTAAIYVFDDMVPDPCAYRAEALQQEFRTIQTGEERWQGIALLDVDQTLPRVMAEHWPGATPRLTFFRQSPAGQQEPNFIHSDEGMGDWTAILYLNPDPPNGDGTTFWRYRPTGEIRGSARALPKDADLWEPWYHVTAQFNRLVMFDSLYFHSRAIEANYGVGAAARLVQVVFGAYP